MAVLDNIEPKRVFHYFEELCSIPHGSSNTGKISGYLADFAENRGLPYFRDDLGNIIIWKKGTRGFETSPVVIIQGHMDMVCEKNSDTDIDFDNEGLRLRLSGNVISAEGTTLGGDDGIAVAYALAILEASPDDIMHPPLEVVITVDEEIGMLGAAGLDYSLLKGRLMLNIDSEDEGKLLAGCAGGATASCHIPVEFEEGKFTEIMCVSVTGVTGGHSGTEIIRQGANASIVLGGLISALNKRKPFRLVDISGGLKDNAIPREARAYIAYDSETDLEAAAKIIAEYAYEIRRKYENTDSNLDISTEVCSLSCGCMTKESTERVLYAITNAPNGVIKFSEVIDGLVRTSLNLGILKTVRGSDLQVIMSFSVRSSVGSDKAELLSVLRELVESLGGYVAVSGDYPAWEYRADSPLRELMISVYEEQYGRKPVIEVIHAGVECGLFSGALEGLDCISFGPQIDDIHTPDERLYVDSTQRTWEYLLGVLRRLK